MHTSRDKLLLSPLRHREVHETAAIKETPYFLDVFFVNEIPANTMLYMKEDTGVIMANTGLPKTAFVFTEHNMINAFGDYIEKRILPI